MNPYDPWVWNNDVNGEQLTVMFLIDDLLLAHMQASVITVFIRKLSREYATHAPLTVTRGLLDLHEVPRTVSGFSYKGLCTMRQYDFIKKLWLELP